MIHSKRTLFNRIAWMVGILFLLNACSSLPLIGKKKERG